MFASYPNSWSSSFQVYGTRKVLNYLFDFYCRTVDYYNLPDNCILETTSNPLWVAAVYTRMAQRDKEAADNPENGRLVNGHEKSHIMRATALLVLLNSDKYVMNYSVFYFLLSVDVDAHITTGSCE